MTAVPWLAPICLRQSMRFCKAQRQFIASTGGRRTTQQIANGLLRSPQLGGQIAAAMQTDLHQAWPATAVRVDVCYYVPEIGHAYTTTDPPDTTLSSNAPALQGIGGFEILFHEASHTFADKMMDALSAECGAQKNNCGDLWHAVLFYTAGTEVHRALSTSEQAGFVPYAYKYGLYTRGNWPAYRAVIENDWQGYLDGKIDFPTAIHSMVSDLH